MNPGAAIRNVKIYEEYLTGAKLIDVAGRYGIALATVKGIVADHRRADLSAPFDHRVTGEKGKQCLTLNDMKKQLNLHVGQKLKVNGVRYEIEKFYPTYVFCKRSNGTHESFLFVDLWKMKFGGGEK